MLLEELRYAQIDQRSGVTRKDDIPEPARRCGPARMEADGGGRAAGRYQQSHPVVVPALLQGVVGDAALGQHRMVDLQQPILVATPLRCIQVGDDEVGQVEDRPGCSWSAASRECERAFAVSRDQDVVPLHVVVD